ncbi:MAG: ABC transporter substrate-binding protein [Bacteroidaceae bacterium]|nr:ABC transporter substrate-binding protein [Bacteroidaceae bacterium]
MKQIIFLSIILIFSSCAGKKKQTEKTIQGKIVTISDAKGFSIEHTRNYAIVTVNNPWKTGSIYDRYYLVKNDTVATPTDGQKVLIPLKSLMVNSATHLGFLKLLGELDKVTGVSNPYYIYDSNILKRVKEGKIKTLGDSFNLDIENLLLLHPQAVMTTAYNAEDENSKRMKKTGLTLLYDIEWQEPTLLGRAEWIKFIAAFFDKENLANTIYAQIRKKYEDLKKLSLSVKKRPTVFSGQDYRGTWHMAGGKSYTAQLFKDAGANYYYANDSTATSIPGTIEEALVLFNQTDIWIGVEANSLKELGKANDKYKYFKAYKNKEVFNTNKRKNNSGGNDYWETGVARPDLLLSDMIKICHPDLLPDYTLTFYEQLK